MRPLFLYTIFLGIVSFFAQNVYSQKPLLANEAYYRSARIHYSPGLNYDEYFVKADIYQSRLFGLKELSFKALNLILPQKLGAPVFNISTFGGEIYTENSIAMHKVYRIGSNFAIFAEATRHTIAIKTHSSSTGYTLSPGLTFHYNKSGTSVRILNALSSGDIGESRYKALHFSGYYQLNSMFVVRYGMLKESRFQLQYSFEVDAAVTRSLRIFVSPNYNPDTFTAGVNIITKRLAFQYILNYHSQLGSTSSVGMSIFRR